MAVKSISREQTSAIAALVTKLVAPLKPVMPALAPQHAVAASQHAETTAYRSKMTPATAELAERHVQLQAQLLPPIAKKAHVKLYVPWVTSRMVLIAEHV